MTSKVVFSYLDHSGERSPATFRGVTLTAVNFTAQMGLIDDLRDALADITLATLSKDTRVAVETIVSNTRPANVYAQRENKWLVRYTDNVNPVGDGSLEIPAPDLAFLNNEGTFLDVTTTEGVLLLMHLRRLRCPA